MSFDKTKFTANPQLDSEGFMNSSASCLGCDGNEPCPRSGMCERYNSPLRFYDKNTITLHPGEVVVLSNPPGWNEPGMQPITWAERCCSLRQESQTAYESGLAIDIHEELFRQ